MKLFIVLGVLFVVIFVYVTVLALCKSASKADDDMETCYINSTQHYKNQ